MPAPHARPQPPAPDTISISEFKARCLELLETLRSSNGTLVITKHGTPIARVTPVRPAPTRLRGLLKDQVRIRGDLVHVDLSADWEVNR